jgi:hypothetical protein
MAAVTVAANVQDKMYAKMGNASASLNVTEPFAVRQMAAVTVAAPAAPAKHAFLGNA